MSNEITRPANGFLDTVKELSLTPYPPAVFASSLFITPFLQTSAVAIPQQQQAAQLSTTKSTISRLLPFGNGSGGVKTIKSANPTNLSCLLFGSFLGLGSFMIYDHDLVNGSGVVSAWSILFSLVNFRKGLLSFSFWPKWLVGLGLFNGYMYGRTFIMGTNNKSKP